MVTNHFRNKGRLQLVLKIFAMAKVTLKDKEN